MSDELVLREHGKVVLPMERLGARDLRAVALVPADLLRVRRVANGHELRTGSVTGVVELDGLRVRVAPKLFPDGAAVLSWLAYAAGVPVDLDQARTWQVDGNGLRDLVVAALLAECARVARVGLRLDYRREQAVDTMLRGRLDVRAQLTRRYGRIDLLHLDRFARRSDVWENLVCRVALDEAARTGGSSTLRQAANGLAAAFPSMGRDRGWAVRTLRRARYNRLNSRYRAAHLWASVLLGSGGIDDLLAAGELGATSLLVRTDRVWERAVARACSDAAAPAVSPPRIRVLEDSLSVREFRPDAHLHHRTASGPLAVPVDAKYKDYANRAVDRDDVHQLLTYASASSEPTAVLVYPVVGVAATRGVVVRADRRLVGRIVAMGVDTRLPPQAAVDALRGQLRRMDPPATQTA